MAQAIDAPPRWSRLVDLGSALLADNRFEEADAVLARGLAAFPDDRTLSIKYALSANNSQRYLEAVARWNKALMLAPDVPACHFCLAANFREIGHLEAATQRITEGLRRFPRDLGVVAEAARIAEADGDFGKALVFWEQAVAKRQPPVEWLRGHAHALILVGRFAEADAAIESALAKNPGEQLLLAVQAILASSREDWPRAVALWTAYRQKFPNDGTGWQHLGRAVQGGLLHDQESPARAKPSGELLSAPLQIEVVADEELRRLLLTFESIGENCEFGLVQRRYGAEPLGLLRWNDVGFDNLLRAVDQRFEGMGDADNTELAVIGNGEFIVRDRRWDLWMHTFLFEGQTDREPLFGRMCRRVTFLRDKLLADLAAAEKTFVFRSDGIDPDQLEALHRGLRAFGAVRLLDVQPAGAATGFQGAPGEIMRVAEDRYVGFLGRLGVGADNHWDIAFDDWALDLPRDGTGVNQRHLAGRARSARSRHRLC